MKQTYYFLLLFLGVFISACNGDDSANGSGGSTSNNPSGPFVAQVDGESFQASSYYARFIPSTRMLQILGQTSGSTQTIHFSLIPFTSTIQSASDWAPGTYDFDPIHVTQLAYLLSGMYTQYNGTDYINYNTKWEYVQSGQVVITENTGDHIKGTFHFEVVKQNSDGSFDASQKKSITQGSFDLPIQ